jgi:ABC-type multidrug transport system ATPase subunit
MIFLPFLAYLILVFFPEILLLDEPTTGLDSCTTRNLVSNLSDIAYKGKIVILTIHQPRSDIFKMFDKIGILSMGEIVYFGKADQIVPYFGSLGFPCPTYANPLDHYGNTGRDLSLAHPGAKFLEKTQVLNMQEMEGIS